MTLTTPQPPQPAWLLRITITAAPAAPARWREQLQSLRSVADYDPGTQTWRLNLGALDTQALDTLQLLYEAARTYGTSVHLEPVLVPASWTGPAFSGIELAAIAAASHDTGRALGQLPLP
ncbi:hypothetical protein ABT010_33485 [Streptomyces sp. NPDC002668]|uniref:hypothetical protein n=1 Tax=Streptomyces sp. NPDC002668 TaxID=3154422 RepID=UPI00332685BC